jgi:hypothetical protein
LSAIELPEGDHRPGQNMTPPIDRARKNKVKIPVDGEM